MQRGDGLLLVVVVCAMGHSARVCNRLHDIDTWVRVDTLYIEKP
jgi:hypothetical protein